MSEENKFKGALEDDDAILTHTKRVRVVVLDGIMSKPASELSDKEINNLAKMADGLDKQIMGKRRLDVQSQSNEKIGDLANVLNNLVIGQAGVKIKRHDESTETNGEDYHPEIPPIPEAKFIPGELSPVGEQIDVEAIMKDEFDKIRSRPID